MKCIHVHARVKRQTLVLITHRACVATGSNHNIEDATTLTTNNNNNTFNGLFLSKRNLFHQNTHLKMSADEIFYSNKYNDDKFEYR